MGVSYNRLWKMLIDKNMKRIEMQYLATLRAHFYTGNSICLYRATCGAVPDFKKSQTGKYSEIRDFVQGEDPLAAQMPIPDKVCD